jgi:glucose-1-phosphate thymidylyltransferase
MKAVILAGGRGSRLQSITNGLPKQLAQVAGDVHMKHLLDRLPDELSDLIIVTGSVGGDLLEDYISKVKGGRSVTFIRQEVPTGTAHALLLAKKYVENEDHFVVMYADDLYDKEVIRDCLRERNAMLVAEVPDPHRFGIVELRPDGTISGIEEKPEHPKTNLASTGFFVFSPEIFNYEPKVGPKGEYYLTSMIEGMIKDGRRIKAVTAKHWLPFNDMQDHGKVEKALKEGLI